MYKCLISYLKTDHLIQGLHFGLLCSAQLVTTLEFSNRVLTWIRSISNKLPSYELSPGLRIKTSSQITVSSGGGWCIICHTDSCQSLNVFVPSLLIAPCHPFADISQPQNLRHIKFLQRTLLKDWCISNGMRNQQILMQKPNLVF